MRIAVAKLREECRARGMSLAELLRRAGVSRNAFYSLARKDTVLPESVMRIARELGEPPLRFLAQQPSIEQQAYRIAEEVNRIAIRHCGVDRDNVRHTLLLLQEEPVDRLRRALRRGRRTHIQ